MLIPFDAQRAGFVTLPSAPVEILDRVSLMDLVDFGEGDKERH